MPQKSPIPVVMSPAIRARVQMSLFDRVHRSVSTYRCLFIGFHRNPARYPRRNDGRSSDANIDHRRIPFQKAYLKYYANQLQPDTSVEAGLGQ